MSDIDTRLDQALKADAPALRDPMFRVQVLLRRERAAFRRRLATTGAMVLGLAILAALGLGAVGSLVRPGPEQATIITAAAVVLGMAVATACAGLLGVFGPWRARASSAWRAMAAPLRWP